MVEEPDFLDELIAERTARNPEFPRLVEAAAARRRALIRELDHGSEKHGCSQAAIAAEIENGEFTCR